LMKIRADLKGQLPPFNADSAPALIPNIIAGRIANRLDLMGPTYTVDAACASSLLAIEMAVRDLRNGDCDLALVGGAHVVTPVPVLMLFCQLNALSRSQQIRPFDRKADGTILGEGIGMVVLKRMSDALRDGNRIYALVKGVGVASDGRGTSVMAPRVEGEILALERAYAAAGVAPQTVGLIEAHGTGTPVGDAIEVESLIRLFGPRSGKYPPCALGSVKSMIGHLMPAAGIAGVIKAALALHHKILPPTLHVEEPLPQLCTESVPFYVNSGVRPWIHASTENPRRAGVNAFGFGGINAHVVLEEAPRSAAPAQFHHHQWDTEVLVIGAESRAGLVERLEQIGHFLTMQPETRLVDLAYTCNAGGKKDPIRVALVAESVDDLLEKVSQVLGRLKDPTCRQIKDVRGIYYFEEPLATSGGLAFLFPGEGSQYPNMLADLCLHFPEVRQRFDEIERVFARHRRGFLPSDVIFPRAAFSEEDERAAIQQIWGMEGAVEAVLTANRALYELLRRLGIEPDAIVGHSTGEYSAMIASGMIDLADEERLNAFCLEMNEIHQGAGEDEIERVALIAVAAPADKVTAIVDGMASEIYLAMDNCPHQSVLVCAQEMVAGLLELLSREGLIYERLAFDRPYHTPRFGAYASRFAPFFKKWLTAGPAIKAYSCTTMAPFPDDVAEIQKVALAHWMEPVRFRRTVESMYEDGIRLFVEIGTGGNLTSFVADTLRGKKHLAIAANTKSRSGIAQLNHLAGMLAAQGLPVQLDYLYAHRKARALDLEGTAPSSKKASTVVRLKTGWPGVELSAALVKELQQRRMTSTEEVDGSKDALLQPVARYGEDDVKENRSSVVPTTEGDSMNNNGSSNYTAQHVPSQVANHAVLAPAAADVMLAHMRTMERFLEVQQGIMQAYLTGRATTPPARLASYAEPVAAPPLYDKSRHSHGNGHATALPASLPVYIPAEVEPLPAAQPLPAAPPVAVAPAIPEVQPIPSETPGWDREAIHNLLLTLISERTGYPTDMLDIDLDLEADLGIDSIKRVEILGLFQNETKISLVEHMEELSKRKNLRAILDFLAERVGQ
jgi:acyl transferase domain-containing protein/acyl carrier protein